MISIDAPLRLWLRPPMVFPRSLGTWGMVAILLWTLVLGGIMVRTTLRPQKNTVVTTYLRGGERWIAGKDLYKGKRGFVYSPPAAALFAPLSVLPRLPADLLWRAANAAALLGGMAWWLRLGLYRGIPKSLFPLAFLVLLPLSIGNFNNGQVNPLIAGLLLIAAAACHTGRFTIAAICVAVSTYFKIYPLAFGLLLLMAYPGKFGPRLLLALAGIAALSFVLQKPPYVVEQYRLWWETRIGDNRFAYQNSIAPRDLWMLFRLFGIPISVPVYTVLQAASGMAIAAIIVHGRLKGWAEDRLLAALLNLGVVWMLLCGPATESATYVLLAPAVALAFAQAWALPRFSRWWISLVLAILLIALGMNSFLKLEKTVHTLSVQPFAALLFGGYALYLLRREFRPALAGAAPVSAALPFFPIDGPRPGA